jgi:hypothetical protein
MLQKQDMRVWTGFFYKKWEASSEAVRLSGSDEEL